MKKERIKLILWIIMIFVGVAISYKLPHDSYAIIQYIIKPIEYPHGSITLSGLVPLILFVIAIKGIVNLEIFAKKNKLAIILVIFIIVIPLMRWTIDFARTDYYVITNAGINSLDINTSSISFSISNHEVKMNVNLQVKDYGLKNRKFRVRVYLPQSLYNFTDKKYIDLPGEYISHGYRSNQAIQQEISIDQGSIKDENILTSSEWYFEDATYVLYNENQEVKIIQHGN